MGYTHYWDRPPTIPDDTWEAIRKDFEKLILPLSDAGVVLAGGLGTGPPEITEEVICFNGPEQCGHPPNEELVIPYPSTEAEGIGPSWTAIDGDFYGVGVTVKHRCCNGSCCFETFAFERVKQLRPGEEPDENGLYGEYVKTGFRPYAPLQPFCWSQSTTLKINSLSTATGQTPSGLMHAACARKCSATATGSELSKNRSKSRTGEMSR